MGNGLQLCLLSGFELRYGSLAIGLPLGAQRLIAFLAIHGRPVLRGFVAGNLWSEQSEEHASRSLRTALWRLRKQTQDELLTVSDSHVGLGHAVSIDLLESTECAQRLLRGEANPLDVDSRRF